MQKMKNFKLFNFRPFVFGFLSLVLGGLLAYSLFISYYYVAAFCLLLLLFVVLVVARKWYSFLHEHFASLIIVCVCFILGFASMGIRETIRRKNIVDEGVYFVSAKVVGSTKYDGFYKTYISSVELYDTSSKKKVLNTKEDTTIWTDNEYEIGDKIQFVGQYTPSLNNSISSLEKSYKINVFSQPNVVGNSKNFILEYKSLILKKLNNRMDDSSAGTIYAMLCGDKSRLPSETTEAYRAAGVGHILAVSGLHVGFFVLLLSFLFDSLRINKKIKFAFITLALALFCVLCGFSYSILRASIMSVVLLYAGLRGKQYDGLSALCFATIIVLGFINPYQLFSVGFLLSFFSIFSLFCLSRFFEHYFSNVYPKRLASGLAVGLSTTIGILPWQILYFGYFSTFGIFVNIIVIPIISLAFMLSFIFVPLALLLSAFNILLYVPQYILFAVNKICDFVNAIPYSTISGTISPITIIVWFLAVLVCSDYIFLPRKVKFYSRIGATVLSVLLLGLNVGGVF